MLTITLLGTAATMPLPERALTAAVAECGGHSLLLDCGEGTQTAARRAGVNLMRADAICLTHYHGDHIFGLPGLLQTLGAQGRTRPLVLLGPEGLLEDGPPGRYCCRWPQSTEYAVWATGWTCPGRAGSTPKRRGHWAYR